VVIGKWPILCSPYDCIFFSFILIFFSLIIIFSRTRLNSLVFLQPFLLLHDPSLSLHLVQTVLRLLQAIFLPNLFPPNLKHLSTSLILIDL